MRTARGEENGRRSKGQLLILLHGHLPFVKHPEYPDFLEEDWLFEALTECYIPLLDAFGRLRKNDIPFRLAMVLSPPLCEMLADETLMNRCSERLRKMTELTEREMTRLGGDARFAETARMYRDHFRRAREFFEEVCWRRILPIFRSFRDSGHLEIVTTSATHAVLPLLTAPEAVDAQIRVATENHRKHFGDRPSGFWLPECAYAPHLDRALLRHGVRYVFVDAHGLGNGFPPPPRGIARPAMTPDGLAVFARDPDCSRQVWSAAQGYPGDPAYREFYRDLGYDAEESYIREYLHGGGMRHNLGIKYYRITGSVDLNHKAPYVPADAFHRAVVHAEDFVARRDAQTADLERRYAVRPVMVAPYDAELFGHWWFEGPRFLEHVFRFAGAGGSRFATATPSEILHDGEPPATTTPSLSSWGDRGYFRMWVNKENDWTYHHLHIAAEKMIALARRFPYSDGVPHRALNQAARELLLAQSSDWPFIMATGTSVPYAHKRFREHVDRFHRLHDEISRGGIDETFLADLERRDSIFPELDYRVYR